MRILLFSLLYISASALMAQKDSVCIERIRNNVISSYVGLIEYNFNYERTLIHWPKAHTNIRLGFGYFTNLQVEGKCPNIALVHLLGMKSSHLELNLGIKYLIDKAGKDSQFLPDIFIGYRFEKPDGRFIFRVGLSVISLFNIGIGVKI